MGTLMAHKANGGWGGRWVLKDGAVEIATARHPFIRSGFEMEIAGRRLTVSEQNRHREIVVVDDATGQQVLELIYTVFLRREEAAYITLPTGATLHWMLNLQDRDLMTGFYDDTGAPVVTIGNYLPWQPWARHGTWGNLWRFWYSFAQAADHYQASVEDATAARLVRTDELLTLIMLGVWMDVTRNSRHS
jgi:hypothetical protein